MRLNYVPIGIMVLGLVFVVNLFGLKPFCLGALSYGSLCIGIQIPLNLFVGLALLVIGAVALLNKGRRGVSSSLKALGLLLVLIAIIGFVGGTANFQSVLGGTSSALAGTNYTVAFVLFGILGLVLYLQGRKGRR